MIDFHIHTLMSDGLLLPSELVARVKRFNCTLIINSDTHAPEDLLKDILALKIILGAGLTEDDYERTKNNAEKLLEKILC